MVFDKIAQEEAEKQFQKVQASWLKEEAQRIELLKKVYKEREEAVNLKSNFLNKNQIKFLEHLNEQDKLSIVKEREELEREIKKHMENIERAKSENFNRKKNHQNDLLYQISEKEKIKNKEIHDRALEERTAKLLEMEYLRKIEEYKHLQLKKVILLNKK